MLIDGIAGAAGLVRLGPLANGTLPGTLAKPAGLGCHQELTIATEMGKLVAVATDLDRDSRVGERLGPALAALGVPVAAA